MISVEDLRESLRHQLSALIALYEDDPAARQCLRHGGEGTREDGGAPAAGRDAAAGEEAMPEPETTRAVEIETCLVAFEAAIVATERAERARAEAQRIALAAMERGAATRRVAAALRQDLQRLLLAAGRSPADAEADLDARRITELRAALRMGEASCRNADREALAARRRAEIVISAASAALLAAVQADPGRGNPALDPTVARAARAVAERAADEAEHNLEEAIARGDGVVVPFGRGASTRPGAGESSR